jgi:hypothetical protein
VLVCQRATYREREMMNDEELLAAAITPERSHLNVSTVRQAMVLAALYFLSMATKLAANRIAERKLRDRQARRADY